MFRSNLTAQAIDEALAETFPASDPPAWTPGMARPAPQIRTPPADREGAARAEGNDVRADVSDATRPTHSGRTFAEKLASLVSAAGLALLLPLAVLAIGAPVALGLRAVLEVIAWWR